MSKSLSAFLFGTLLFPALLQAQVRMPATTRAGIAELQKLSTRFADAEQLHAATQGSHPTALIHGRCMVGFLGKVNDAFELPDALVPHVLLGAQVGNIRSFRMDALQLGLLGQIPGLEYVELAGKVKPDLDKLVVATRVDSVHAGIQLPQGYSGEGVLIGITDWGFDYTHPMFRDTSLTTSRVRAVWDHYRQAGPAPAGFGYGTELSEPSELIAAGSDTANIYSYSTHGSHVAGIAGGSGIGTAYRGVAFGAQFLFNTFLVDAAAVIDAFVWMKNIADQDQKRLVVNMSWGLYHMGTLDGTSLISQAIDQMSEEGVVFVTSGGNNGNVSFHIRKNFSGDVMRSRIQFYPYNAHPRMWGQSISMWGEPGRSFAAGFSIANSANTILQESPLYQSATQEYYLDSMLVQGNDTVFFNLTTDAAHPLNGRPHFRLRIKNTNTQLNIALKATAEEGTVHFWNVTELTNDVGNWGQAFLSGPSGWTAGDTQFGIGEPACTERAITVAAYSAETYASNGSVFGGSIASFSSFGPTLDERMKPDITAPGQNVASSISSFTDASFNAIQTVDFEGRQYPFARFSGTSMSSPAVAGIAALLLQAAPDLSPAELRELLRETARTDTHTGIIPAAGSTRWGAGKVNAYRAMVELLGLVGVEDRDKQTLLLWPNPTNDALHLMPTHPGAMDIRIMDATGRLVHNSGHVAHPGAPIQLSVKDLAPGLYLLTSEQAGERSTLRFLRK